MGALGIRAIEHAMAMSNLAAANRPGQEEREAARIAGEHGRMLGSMDMGLRQQQQQLEREKHEWQRHMDLVGAESEYLAAMGQETKAPTDPRLTQTHRAAVAKGQYARQGAQAAAATARQNQEFEVMKMIADQENKRLTREGQSDRTKIMAARLAEQERANRARQAGYNQKTAAMKEVYGGLKTNQAMSQIQRVVGNYEQRIKEAMDPMNPNRDTDLADKLKAERDRVVRSLMTGLGAHTQQTIPGASEVLRAFGGGESFDTSPGGLGDVDSYPMDVDAGPETEPDAY